MFVYIQDQQGFLSQSLSQRHCHFTEIVRDLKQAVVVVVLWILIVIVAHVNRERFQGCTDSKPLFFDAPWLIRAECLRHLFMLLCDL